MVKDENSRKFKPINEELHETIIGLVLGDLHIRKRFKNSNLIFKGSSIHKEYIMFLYELFLDYCKSQPRIYEAKLNNKIYYSVAFETLTNADFNYYHNIFYNNMNRSFIVIQILFNLK